MSGGPIDGGFAGRGAASLSALGASGSSLAAGLSRAAATPSASAVEALETRSDHPSGLGLVPHVRVIPHFDKMLAWVPDMLRNALLGLPEGTVLLGIDEDTALVGGPHEWKVQGRQSVWVLGHGKRVEHKAGSTLVTP